MTPLQARILRALDVPKSTARLGSASQASLCELLDALDDAESRAWLAEDGGLWSRTPAGTEALAAAGGAAP